MFNRAAGFLQLIFFCLLLPSLAIPSCTSSTGIPINPPSGISLTLDMTRLAGAGLNPFRVTVNVTKAGVGLSGQTLSVTVPKGSVGPVQDNSDGTYTFTVTPASTGTYPVTVALSDTSITRKAVVIDAVMTGLGQPMAVPGDYVNTIGYEDGITITPDGQYLFVQYGPFYMSGLVYLSTICSTGTYSIGYDLNTCNGRPNSSLVFNPIGPYNNWLRPNFISAGIDAGIFHHIPSLIISGQANGVAGFPTAFYGFKRQADGSFAQPFKVGFNDARGLSGPYGLSFKMNGDGTGTFVVAWQNAFNDLGGDGKPDIYTGTLTFGQSFNMGNVTYSGDLYSAITPIITPVGFASHAGVQGNPHLYYDGAGIIRSIWTDDEQITNDLSVYRLTSGTFPNGTWVQDTLPSVINTAAQESQPFFTGTQLIFRRGVNIVSHAYLPTNGACANGFTNAACWGPEVIMMTTSNHTAAGEILGVGEPTIATINGRRYMYFVYLEARANAAITGGLVDINAEAGFVEIP